MKDSVDLIPFVEEFHIFGYRRTLKSSYFDL